MTDFQTEIVVIIVNYGTVGLALDAVASVLGQPGGGRRTEVHLVDNASPNGDGERLPAAIATRGWQDRVTLHLSTENRGFGCGNNIALEALARREIPPDKVFLLNPDARLDNDAISHLAAFLDAHPKAGAVGAALADADGQPAAAAFRFPSIAGEFAEAVNFGPVSRLLGRWRIPMAPDLPGGRVDWVTGAAVMFRFDALRQTGFFDPGFFLYYEEVELIRRLARAGWSCWHLPEARVVHIEGAATELRGDEIGLRRRPSYWYESRRLYSYRAHGRLGAIVNGCMVILGAACNHAISRLRGRRAWLPAQFISDTWRIVLRPLLGGWKPR